MDGIREIWYRQSCFFSLFRWIEFRRDEVKERCGDQMKEVMGKSFTFNRTRMTFVFVSFVSDAL